MKPYLSIFLFLGPLLLSTNTFGQSSLLGGYINEGLENNIVLKQKTLDYRKSVEIIKQAKSYYWPEITVNARFSRADGGRTIDLPVGDMLNPVYSTLNQLTGTAMFPQIENQQFDFLRTQEHETKIRLTQPILNGEIYYKHKMSQAMSNVKKQGRNAYARELVSEIKKAYFNYLKSIGLLEVLNKNKRILDENLYVNKKMYENQKVTYDHVLKSKTRIAEWEEAHAGATEKTQKARLWFNFLLNRDLGHTIEKDTQFDSLIPIQKIDTFQQNASQREEMEQVYAAAKAARYNEKLMKSNYWPELTFVFDYGFQGKHYQFEHDDDFYIASLVLQWPLFRGMRRNSKLEKARIGLQEAELEKQKVQKQIDIQLINAYYSLRAAYKKYEAKTQQVKHTKATWKIINKKYRQGMVNQLEHINALEEFRIAQEQQVISRYDFYIKKARLEKVAAQINMEQKYDQYEK
ncbi:MAG TPA: TolC family protein [Salinivirga sp.]|uniref:TolC family protein n=1 Tax=Salinivirga sp. TaxID=1970192 RepID=UPI002B48A5EB|nr:TolC family protein [Salinivirga sp.]HKK60150.1 TolC family protein [Salinivirga sp.]